MMSNTAGHSTEKPSIMSFDKSTVIVWVAISLIVSETLAGALRFYLDKAGISALLYLPKAGCLILFAIELLSIKASRAVWVGFLLLLISATLAMLHGATISNLAFSLFVFSPMLFGMVCSDHLLHRKRLLCWVVGLCLVMSIIGLLLDKYTTVPWKGYSYTLGNTELAGNTAWIADENDRIAGFTRVSNILAALIAIYTLYLAMFTRSKFLFGVLCAVGLYSIVLTTSKAPAAAFVITLLLMTLTRLRWSSAIAFVTVVVMGIGLPIIGLLHDFDPNGVTSADPSLTSLYDRLVNTWPHIFTYMHNQSWSITGAGFGMFGATEVMFPVAGAGLLTVSDSSAMYLWCTFGVVGIALYLLQIPLLFLLRDRTSRMDLALLSISICICLISWTTDMFEVTISNLFMGLAIGRVMFSSTNTIAATTPVFNVGHRPRSSEQQE